MKIKLLFLLMPFFFGYSQIKEPVHLSFELTEINKDYKVRDENGYVHFYMQDQHFKSLNPFPDYEEFNPNFLQQVEIIEISEFLEVANKERKRLIVEGERNQSLKILFNNEVFKKIYLYQKINKDCISRLEVVWIEEIE